MKQKDYSGWPTYEIELPLDFDITFFSRDVEQGRGKLWLVNLEREPGIWRYKGVVRDENVRVFIDIFYMHQKSKNQKQVMFVTTPWYQNLTALEVARIVQKELGVDRIYHEGKEVLE